jgi:hypothetical protein
MIAWGCRAAAVGSNSFRARCATSSSRDLLAQRKSVNAGLRRTILEEPGHFLAYNNGIVATADDIEMKNGPKGELGITLLRGLQIVNGGQTTASLHRARKQDKTSLDGIAVPAKIIKVKAENLDAMVAAVSRSANRQKLEARSTSKRSGRAKRSRPN